MSRLAKINMPPFAYVPGETPRHDATTFDAVHASVHPGMTPEVIAGTLALQAGLAFYRAGFFWESHEALEPVWMILPDGPERERVRALIQLANAALKLRMGRPGATVRLCARVTGHLAASAGARLPIPESWLEQECKTLRDTAQKQQNSAL